MAGAGHPPGPALAQGRGCGDMAVPRPWDTFVPLQGGQNLSGPGMSLHGQAAPGHGSLSRWSLLSAQAQPQPRVVPAAGRGHRCGPGPGAGVTPPLRGAALLRASLGPGSFSASRSRPLSPGSQSCARTRGEVRRGRTPPRPPLSSPSVLPRDPSSPGTPKAVAGSGGVKAGASPALCPAIAGTPGQVGAGGVPGRGEPGDAPAPPAGVRSCRPGKSVIFIRGNNERYLSPALSLPWGAGVGCR